ncbi:MAG: hypothetical protein ACE37E_15340 [Hyphomicrobiales bacterium]
MLETIAALALCVQVSDYAAFHLSYHPQEQAASDQMYAQSEEWAGELSQLVPDANSYIIALHDADKIAYGLDGEALIGEFDRCQASNGGADLTERKG